MSLTPSSMLPLGTKAPAFQLATGDGKNYTSEQLFKANGLLVVFMSNHCPYVIHVAKGLAKLSTDIEQFDVGMVGINSNDVIAYPADSPEKMVDECKLRGYDFPYLFDQTQAVAKAYQAACTPDFFLFDGNKELVYRGQFDSSRPGNNIAVTGDSMRQAIMALSNKKPISPEQTPSIGCNIKWK